MIAYLLQWFRAWLALLRLIRRLNGVREFKGDQQKVDDMLSADEGVLSEDFKEAQGVFKDDGFWKTTSGEEVKFDHSNLEDINNHFQAKFTHTQEGQKMCIFLCNYLLPMYSVAFNSLAQSALSLGSKKKKKTTTESPLTKIVIQPIKESLKEYKEWINHKIAVYKGKCALPQYL